ncbi:uncharacterized protein RJT21DRAFT_121388 [Scheffersomyces amazonensis]|uniref:uncharacterized protein n=1 Tax=Scheffersomyces amazonensis TaxID=1078765 RepID=UPI00315DCD8A
MPTFKQVDVFTNVKFKGNPLAVFFDAVHLTTAEMKSISNWTNLSETTFVLPPTTPDADYKVRIFTTQSELPFAGHPTIGTCFSLLEAGLIKPNKDNKIIQECGAGLVEITIKGYDEEVKDLSQVFLSFKLPYYKPSEINEDQILEVANSLSISTHAIEGSPVLIDDGPKWLTFQLQSGQAVLDLEPNYSEIANLSIKYDWAGYNIFGKHDDGSLELRSLAPVEGINEDPACGSGAGAAGAYIGSILNNHKISNSNSNYFLNQGSRIGRDAKLTVHLDTDNEGKVLINVGGQAVTCIDGNY